ncbi:hypothetical protein [Wenjunlia tyrosinilytica]|uniref:Uncharacterized protein n=1 Tax=Wenjunlia tyrosinilytica TaxID=1544741 RepID=A0A917ZVP5_9ACTN|nr:hypothetical protein [Wenjunlia tyrosinilytica]GGO96479.1 hypothetical protein GCM10012280_56060 [Wenjunlia tyrosinilytica]
MEAANLASLVVQVMSGAATAAGNGVGQAVSDLVRERLGRSEQGRAALAGSDAAPADPTAAQGLRTALQDALAADTEFAGLVAAALAGPAPSGAPPVPPGHTTGSVVIGGSSLRGSQISLGPLTISNTRSGRGLLVALASLFVALVALATYGGVHMIGGGDTPGAAPGTRARDGGLPGGVQDATGDGGGGGGGGKQVTLTRAEQVKAVLPDLRSMPSGWTLDTGPDVESARGCSKANCEGMLFGGGVQYTEPGNVDKAEFGVAAYSSAKKAAAGYDVIVRQNHGRPVSLPAIGDRSSAVESVSEAKFETFVLVGSVVVGVEGQGSTSTGGAGGGFDPATLEAMTRMIAERAQQAQNGRTPAASVNVP